MAAFDGQGNSGSDKIVGREKAGKKSLKRRFCKKKSNVFAAVLLSALVFTAAQAGRFPLSVKDASGKNVTIHKAPRRIVSLAPSVTETLYALGLENRIVGVTKRCDYPSQASKKPKVGDFRTSIEAVVALKPDLVIGHAFLNRQSVTALEKLGLNVITFDPKTIKEVQNDILILGKITGTESEAELISKKISAAIKKSLKTTAKLKKPPKILVIIQAQPLWVAGPKTFVDEMIKAAHCKNIAYDAKPGFNLFSTEIAVSRAPDAIIIRQGGLEEIESNPLLKRTPAVKNKRVYELNMDLFVRPGPRLADGVAELARIAREVSK